MNIQFEFLPALLLLAIIPGLFFLYSKYNSSKKESLLKFSSLSIIKKAISGKSFLRKHLPFVLLLIVVSLIIIALANPQIPSFSVEKGINLSIVIDGSESMSAKDYQPTRMEAAKRAVSSLVGKLNQNDNVGIVLFESGATTISYMTPVKEKTIDAISSIQQSQGATALGDGVSLGIDMVSSIPDKKNILILLSDGVHNSGLITPDEAIDYAKMNNVQIHTIGLGSEEPVFLRNDVYGEPQYVELDEQTLKKIADETNGKYFKSVDEKTLNEIFTLLSSNMEYQIEWASISQWFIGAAMALLLANVYIIYGRYRIAA
ncbi:MAG: VWA domain-containing protein [Crenarchaeota archaeon]|nr:MAG: VWA domain-containing protein [Thermoproteota archaeon]RDJ33252.1 MAG: VWA domain-containing protein [Thermoproteota archaeon]RDJ36245.1 MAG: VWA domain-containing protein [Thermoproteota archaeon]RDJ38875.1 MAG: VWA domain-containing protein [Thermoproteota archaeon]